MANLYFDNGSTSYPKPPEVVDAMCDFMTNIGGSYGRSSHKRAYTTTSLIEECRDAVGVRMGANNGNNIAWCKSATEASNVVISSLDLRGKKVFVSPLEHNCTMRPLVAAGAIIETLPSLSDGRIDVRAIKIPADSALVVVNHQSNVNGVIQPINEIRKAVPGIPILIDTAQSLGHTEVLVEPWAIDYAIFTGHKGLLGPTGTGGLYAREISSLTPLLYGGTGSNSSSYDMPTSFPERLEAGTYNSVGLIGLRAALACNIEPLHQKRDRLDMIAELKRLKGIHLLCANDASYQGELFSFVHHSIDGSTIAAELSNRYDIECRFGLHCAAMAHRTLKSTESGAVRVSLSNYHTPNDLDHFVRCVAELIK